MMFTRRWIKEHKHILLLKLAIAVALTATHFWPESKLLSLVTNLTWLFVF